MAQLPWAQIIKDLGETFEQELEAALRLAKRTASLEAAREPHGIRLAIELRTPLAVFPVDQDNQPELDELRTDHARALRELEQTLEAKSTLEARVAQVEEAKKTAEGSSRRLKARIKEMEAAHAAPAAPASDAGELRANYERALRELEQILDDKRALEARMAEADEARRAAEAGLNRIKLRVQDLEAERPPSDAADAQVADLRAAMDTMRSDLERERIARAAAEATRTFAEREREELRAELQGARAAREAADLELQEVRQLAQDLQAELGEVWRALRETRPGEPMSINVNVSEGVRRAGVERVQAQIVDARALFRRRTTHRWPLAI